MKKLVAAGFLITLCLGFASVALGETVKLEYKFKTGEADKYSLEMTVNAQLPDLPGIPAQGQMKMTMSGTQMQKVVAVYPDGSAKIKVWSGGMKISVTGLPQEQNSTIPSSASYIKMSKRGKVLSVDIPELRDANKRRTTGSGAKLSAIPGMDMSKMINQFSEYGAFPKVPVEFGSSWNQVVPLPMNLGSLALTSALANGYEDYNGIQTVRLTQNLSGHMDVAQGIKAFVTAFASAFNMAGKKGTPKIQIPDIQGGVDISGSSETFFSPTLGKMLEQIGSGKMNINIQLPPEMLKDQPNMPSEIDVVIDGSVSMIKI